MPITYIGQTEDHLWLELRNIGEQDEKYNITATNSSLACHLLYSKHVATLDTVEVL